MKTPEAPKLPRSRMPVAQRAKIFMPFDPLAGYREALAEKEREAVERSDERGGYEEPC